MSIDDIDVHMLHAYIFSCMHLYMSQAIKKTDVRVACVPLRDSEDHVPVSGKMRRRSQSAAKVRDGAPQPPQVPQLPDGTPFTNQVVWCVLAAQRNKPTIVPEIKNIAGDVHCLTLASDGSVVPGIDIMVLAFRWPL